MSTPHKKQNFEAYADEKPFNFSTNPVWEDIVTELVKKSPVPASEMRVLDNGCGDGKLFPNLIRMGFSAALIDGIEVSKTRIERCHAIGFTNAQYLPLHEPLPYADNTFDLINYLEVIEHVPKNEIDFYLKEMARVLKPGGVAIVTTPNYPIKRVIDLYMAFAHKKWARLRDDPTHVTLYTHKSLAKRLAPFFGDVEIRPYKIGPFYKRIPSPYLLHKMVALCGKPIA